jgi:hypothetical protein
MVHLHLVYMKLPLLSSYPLHTLSQNLKSRNDCIKLLKQAPCLQISKREAKIPARHIIAIELSDL